MNITIEQIETFVIRVPERADFRWLSLSRPLGEFVLAKLHAGSEVGWGEIVALRDWGDLDGRRHGETPETVTALVHEQLGPELLGAPFTLGELTGKMDRALVGNPYAKTLIDIAVHDLVGQSLGVSVLQLLGGPARTSVPVAHMIGLMTADEAVAEADSAIADGIRALQIKGGADLARDVAVVRAIRAAHGSDMWLRLDANGGYRGRAFARRALAELADAGADLVEQPLLGAEELAEVRSDAPLPIMADEACWTPRDALSLIGMRAVDAVSVYVGKAGGVSNARDICAIAAAAGLPHDLNGALELGIGNAANLHVALASRAELLPSVIPVNGPAGAFPTKSAGRYFEDDIVAAPFEFADGALLPLDAPGLGVDVDEEKVQHYCVDHRVSATEGSVPIV
jgi:L-alanine-DL-glutamate epimerase-like enolase superfamily enzyme